MDSSVAVVSVVNNTTNPNRHPSLNCNALGGGGGAGGVVFVSGGGGLGVGLAENKGIVDGPVATNSSNSCLEVVVGVEGLDLLASAQEQQQLLTTLSTDALTAPIVKGNLINPRQLNQPTTTAILLNPLAITSNSSSSSVAANNNTNCNHSNNNNLNDLMQLTGVTPSTTATTTITTVKIEPSSVLVQQQQQQQHPVGSSAQQSAMTNKRNRMEV